MHHFHKLLSLAFLIFYLPCLSTESLNYSVLFATNAVGAQISDKASSLDLSMRVTQAHSTKSEADRLFWLGYEHYNNGQLTDALQNWQRASSLYRDIGD